MTALQDNIGLVHKITRRVWGRAASFCSDMDYEDFFQEAQRTFLKAESGFDATRGVRFSTYISGAIMNRLNFIADEAIQSSRYEVRSSAMTSSDEDHGEMMERISPDDRTLETEFEQERLFDSILNRLSPVARIMFRETFKPSNKMIQEFQAKEALMRKLGKPKLGYFYLNTVAEFLIRNGMSEKAVKNARREILNLGEL